MDDTGGPSFLSPLRASQIYPLLLDILAPAESAPSLVIAALRSLNAIADAAALEKPTKHVEDDAFIHVLYVDAHLTSLREILSQDSSHSIIQQQISLAASLISKTCKTESRRKQLRYCGILDSLATRVASFLVSPSYLGASEVFQPPFNEGVQPVGKRARLAPILQAVCTIIQDSKIRASVFCCSSVFASVFPSDKDPYAWRAPPAQGGRREGSNGPLEAALPPLNSNTTGKGPNYPPFNTLATWGKSQRAHKAFSSAMEINPTEGFASREDDETPLVPWLIEVVRVKAGLTRLMAIWLLAMLYRANLIGPQKEKCLSMLLVPVLVSMLDKDVKMSDDEELWDDTSSHKASSQTIQQKTPRILALLIAENEDFQRAAADADVIRKLAQLLKQSFDPIPLASITPMWNPVETNGHVSVSDSPNSSKVGPAGLHPLASHTMKMRESSLIALAAMATTKDEYRQVIVDERVVHFIIESLQPYDKSLEQKNSAQSKKSGTEQRLGNPIPILIAACTTARALSRSVGQLRTSFVDQGLAKPIYELLRHPHLEVQIAATSAVINVILEFSPLREVCNCVGIYECSLIMVQQILDAGVLKVLCEHAHSSNAKLRLNAMWALRHLVLSAPVQLKKDCVSELGIGWLKQIICNGTEDSHIDGLRASGDRSGTPIAMGTPNAAGEQVDLLNAMDDRSPNTSFHQDDEDDEVNMVDSLGSVSRQDRYRGSRFTAIQPSDDYTSQYDPALKMRDDNDQDAQTARDDLAIQEQGLGLVRNLTCAPGSSDMVDFLFENLGQDKVFDMLANLLKPRSTDNFPSRRTGGGTRLPVPPPTEVVSGVCYILIHLAASQPRHRQMLVARTKLLESIVALFSHPHAEVRLCCVLIVVNLTWTEDQADKANCKGRAFELRKLGVLTKLHELENDSELEVRERVKGAISQMNDAFGRVMSS